MLTSFGESERALLRTAIAEVGLAKATVVVQAIERFGNWPTWLELAGRECTMTLQAKISTALDALPRGREPSSLGERFRRTVLSSMPDIEAMELVEQFFGLGAKVVGTPNPVGIFLAGCRECLPEWELQAARRLRAGGRDQEQDTLDADPDFCPRGQNCGAPSC